jgi:hypothetical protein
MPSDSGVKNNNPVPHGIEPRSSCSDSYLHTTEVVSHILLDKVIFQLVVVIKYAQVSKFFLLTYGIESEASCINNY